MPHPIVHFEISAKDGAKISTFYSQLFGWTVDANNPMNYGMASTKDGDLGIDGAIYEQHDAEDKAGIRIYAQVSDADSALARAAELGAKIVMPAMEVPGAGIRVGQCEDPEGNRFGVVQPLHDH